MTPIGRIRLAGAGVVLCALAGTVWAGGGPQNTLVVVNDSNLESLELGQYYQEKRGIPEANIFHVRTGTNDSIDRAAFSNEIRGPVTNYIATSGLSTQIDYVVFAWGKPYRVCGSDSDSFTDGSGSFTNANGLSAAMFYDYKPGTICVSYANRISDYFEAERAFSRAGSPSSNRYYVSALLASTNLVHSKLLVDRGVAADGLMPTGTLYLFHPPDPRNVQWTQFENAAFSMKFIEPTQPVEFRDTYWHYWDSGPLTNIAGCMVGGWDMPLSASTFVTGAIAHHLTSNGGYLFTNSLQTSCMDWIYAGCVGTYGTVIEPCAYWQKFPDARLHYWYGRGFTMGESFSMSVMSPFQGVLVGDPLAAPFARWPGVSVGGLASNQVVTNTVSVTVTGAAVSITRPVDEVALYLDGAFLATLTNVPPRTSNVARVTINSTNCTYVVPVGASVYTVATGLTASINASNLGVTASAWGDRVEIRQNALGVAGSWMTCTGGSSLGSAGELTVFVTVPFTNFLETTYGAQRRLTLSGTPVSGDVVRVVVSNLAGAVFTNEVMSDGLTNNSPYVLLTNLTTAINADTNLQNAQGCEIKWVYNVSNFYGGTPVHDACLVARTNTWQGYNLYASYSVTTQPGSTLTGSNSAGNFSYNSFVLSARATVFLSEGRTNLAGAYSLNTTTLADGPHELMAVAYEGTAVRSQGRVKIPFVVNNHTASCVITSPADHASFLLGTSVTVHVSASAAGGGSVSTVQCYVEGKLLASTGTAPYVFTFPATNYGVGLVGVQARSVSSNGDAVLSERRDLVILPDYDFDGIDDNWEIQHFGAITNWGAWDDPDTDGVYNVNEYIADTQPTNVASTFNALVYWRTNAGGYAEVDFGSSTAREYWIHYLENPLDGGQPWLVGSNALAGTGGTSVWYDNGTDLPAPTGSYRFYRVRVLRP